MPPKAVIYHICGQHKAGEALVGYEVGPDTPVMLAPKLLLRGKTTGGSGLGALSFPVPTLLLHGKEIGLSVSGIATLARANLFLNGMAKTVGKEMAMVPTTPGSILLPPTTDEDIVLTPTVEEPWLLIPTTEREM